LELFHCSYGQIGQGVYALLDLKKYPLAVWSPAIEENHLDPLGCPNPFAFCLVQITKNVKAGKQSLTLHDPKDNSTKPNALAFHGQEMGAIQSSTIFPVSNSFDGGIVSNSISV
jgi:hypothetical protein